MRCRLLFVLTVLVVLEQQSYGFEYSEYCEKMCMWGRGGNLCKCNAVHFAGKRVVLRPKSRGAVLARYATWRHSRMALPPAISNTRAPSFRRRLAVSRPVSYGAAVRNQQRPGVRQHGWLGGSGRRMSLRLPRRRLPGIVAYSHQQEPKLYRKSRIAFANRLILH